MFLIKFLCYLSKKKINRREKKIQAKVLIEEKKKIQYIYIYILLHFKSFKSLNSLCNSFLFSIKMSV